MLNKIVLMGRLTTIPEVKYTVNQKAVCPVTIAVDRDKLDANGQRNTDFINVVFWETLGEFVGKWFTKGQMIAAEGRLQAKIWTDKDGQKHRSWEVIANAAYFAGEKPAKPGEQPEEDSADFSRLVPSLGDFEELSDGDDVPF